MNYIIKKLEDHTRSDS